MQFEKGINDMIKKIQQDHIQVVAKMACEKERVDELCDTLRREKETVTVCNIEIAQQNMKLQELLRDLQDELSGYRKVSQIIFYEKENSRLRKEVSELKEKQSNINIQQPIVLPISLSLSLPPPPAQPQPIASEVETESTFYERKIENIVYYVCDEDKIIYAKEEDGSVGAITLGTLQETKVPGKKIKYKADWFVKNDAGIKT